MGGVVAQVLVVEDDRLIAFVLEDALLEAGHGVVLAENADLALNIMENNHFDVLFTDIDMPGSIDGIELANIVRTANPQRKIIIASGKRRPSEQELPKNSIFLPKPYLASEVLKLIE